MARHARNNSSDAFDARFAEPSRRQPTAQGRHVRGETARITRPAAADPSRTAHLDRVGNRMDGRPEPDLSGFDVQLSARDIPGYDETPARRRAMRSEQPTSRWQPLPDERPAAARGGSGRHGAPRHGASGRGSASRPAPRGGGRAPAPAGTAAFQGLPAQRKRHRALWIAGIILVVLLAAYLVFAFLLDSRLAMNSSSTDREMDAALVDAGFNEPFYTLILGSDSREDSGTSVREDERGANERSDVMILARIDAAKRQATLVSIPRDTPYFLESGDVVKINETYNIGGAAASVKAVSEITGVPISHYAEVRFSDVQAIVDILGGVTVDVPITLSYTDALTGQDVTLQPGTQKLDGQQAQIFARARHEYGGNQDARRQESVRSLLHAIAKETLSQPITEMPGTVLDIAEHIGTDMRTADLLGLATAYGLGGGDFTLYSCTGPTDGDLNIYGNGLWFCYDNPEGWSRLMAVVDAGDDPSGIDPNG